MASRSPAQAVHEFIDPRQRMISCVTDAILLHNGDYRPGILQHIRLSEDPAILEGSPRLSLRVLEQFEVVPNDMRRSLWDVKLIAYRYEFETAEGGELLAYHWHPHGRSHVTFPHVHLGSATVIPASPAAGAHLPTGVITLPEVLRLAITDLGITPQREDWERVLTAAQSAI